MCLVRCLQHDDPWSLCRLLLLMGGFLLFFIAFFTVHAIFKVQHIPRLTYQSSVADAACEHAQRPACCPNFQCPWLAG